MHHDATAVAMQMCLGAFAAVGSAVAVALGRRRFVVRRRSIPFPRFERTLHTMQLKWLTCVPIVGALAVAGCGTSSKTSTSPSTSKPQAAAGAHGGGMHMIDKNGGLAAGEDGFRLTLKTAPVTAGRTSTLRFEVQAPDGRPQTDYAIDQTKRLHFYVVRGDLTGYEHLHPTLGPDGTWSVRVSPRRPGPYRVYTDFVAKDPSGVKHAVVLSRPLRIAGRYRATVLGRSQPRVRRRSRSISPRAAPSPPKATEPRRRSAFASSTSDGACASGGG